MINDNMKLAQVIKLPGGQSIQGPLNRNPNGPQFTNISSIMTNALPIIFAIAGLVLFLFLIWGGFDYLTSMGDPKKAEEARGKITNALIGFIIIFVSYWIVQVVIRVFNLGVSF